jgi:hypothetical protein
MCFTRLGILFGLRTFLPGDSFQICVSPSEPQVKINIEKKVLDIKGSMCWLATIHMWYVQFQLGKVQKNTLRSSDRNPIHGCKENNTSKKSIPNVFCISILIYLFGK